MSRIDHATMDTMADELQEAGTLQAIRRLEIHLEEFPEDEEATEELNYLKNCL